MAARLHPCCRCQQEAAQHHDGKSEAVQVFMSNASTRVSHPCAAQRLPLYVRSAGSAMTVHEMSLLPECLGVRSVTAEMKR